MGLWFGFSKLPERHEEYERMKLKNIRHGRVYSSCEFYPECDEAYDPGYIKVSVESREVIEQRDSKFPEWHGRYAHYAKREILNLRAEGNHSREKVIEWVKDTSSEF